jgi:hypothetical protein
MNLVTPNVASKHELLFNKLASELLTHKLGQDFEKNFPLNRIFSTVFQLFITVDNNQVTLMIFFHLFILVIAGKLAPRLWVQRHSAQWLSA